MPSRGWGTLVGARRKRSARKPTARQLEVLRTHAFPPGKSGNPSGVNQFTYRADFEAALDSLFAAAPTDAERVAIAKAVAKFFGRGKIARLQADLALAVMPRDATRAQLSAFMHAFAALISPGHPILTPRLWPQSPLEVKHGGDLTVTLEAREAVARRLDRWLDVVKRDVAGAA